jgi:multidrug resistance efflux pump
MAQGRLKHVKGTKDFLVMVVFFTFLCLWSIRDAWFPTKKVQEKHPQRMEVSMEVSGVIKSLPRTPGEEIGGGMILAEIHSDPYKKALDEAQTAFETAKGGEPAVLEEKIDAFQKAKADLGACTLKCTDVTQQTSHGEDSLQGRFLEYVVEPASYVEAGQTVLFVEPKDSFYLFNKSLAIICFVGAISMLIFHKKLAS